MADNHLLLKQSNKKIKKRNDHEKTFTKVLKKKYTIKKVMRSKCVTIAYPLNIVDIKMSV